MLQIRPFQWLKPFSPCRKVWFANRTGQVTKCVPTRARIEGRPCCAGEELRISCPFFQGEQIYSDPTVISPTLRHNPWAKNP